MLFSLKGIHVPHRKNTAGMPAKPITPPPFVVLPMSMHIGRPAVPTVRVGDTVYVGQKIGEVSAPVSSPIHASVSGTVKKIENMLLSNGTYVPAVQIESDGQMTPDPHLAPPTITDKTEFLSAVRESGVVGLGGAGFPMHIKLGVPDGVKIRALIINGAECEPYITSDTRAMIDRTQEIGEGIAYITRFLSIDTVLVGIEKNKPEAIAAMRTLEGKIPGLRVVSLKSVYPQGGEKVLIYHLTGQKVPEGKLPLDVGCIVCNCTTVAALAQYIQTGMPLVRKCVTVDGSAVRTPGNFWVPIGTPMSFVFGEAGGFSEPPQKLLYGGPMMGIAVPDAEQPILKNTNAILAFGAKEAHAPPMTACIHCGRCVNHCPFGLRSTDIAAAFRAGDGAALERLHVSVCMECGCCAYVCPAGRPLVQTNKLAKGMLRDYLAKKKQEREEAERNAAHAKENGIRVDGK